METIGSPMLWLTFTSFVLIMLALDLGVFNRKAHEISLREASLWSAVWVGLALVFNYGLYHFHGEERALEFLAGYVIEKSLSIDNIFIFLLVFSSFSVPLKYQHRVLFWGVLGALLMRTIFIMLGATLLERYHWILYVFGIFLILTAIKMILDRNKVQDLEKSFIVKLFRKFIPVTKEYVGQKFFVKIQGRWMGTPLLLVLIIIEFTDLIFAVDSIPAIFAVTRDPFIVYTSNIFAILGLRSLYFLLAGVAEKFRYLKIGLAIILGFVGGKLMLTGIYKVPIGFSLGFIGGIIFLSVLASILIKPVKITDKQ